VSDVRVYRSVEEISENHRPSAIAIGKFDGVHTGHRQVIRQLVEVATARDLQPVVVTFDRNPLALLRPEVSPPPLVSNEQKLELLSTTGIDATLVLTFDRHLADLSPEEFVRSVLVDALAAKVVIVGRDFRFGARGSGTVDTLRDFGQQWGFDVLLVGDVVVDVDGSPAKRTSSTWIRELLAQGKVREAATLLGYLPSIRSTVVVGARRGRELGYPTANLAPDIAGFVPADGVYAAWLRTGGERYPAAVSIGNNPTFDGVPDKQVEAHVLDIDIDLYGSVVELDFVDYVRPMVKFSGVTELIEQMEADESRVRTLLGYRERRMAE
jgi:riboflavin kinase/FMN adenylyltransferase